MSGPDPLLAELAGATNERTRVLEELAAVMQELRVIEAFHLSRCDRPACAVDAGTAYAIGALQTAARRISGSPLPDRKLTTNEAAALLVIWKSDRLDQAEALTEALNEVNRNR